jgi:serine/threonine protein kinase
MDVTFGTVWINGQEIKTVEFKEINLKPVIKLDWHSKIHRGKLIELFKPLCDDHKNPSDEQIEKICVERNLFLNNNKEIQIMSRFLRQNKSVKLLNFNHCSIRGNLGTAILLGMNFNRTITRIVLWGNELKDEGIPVLDADFWKDRELDIDLRDNEITNIGYWRLIEGFKHSSHLCKLDLQGNAITRTEFGKDIRDGLSEEILQRILIDFVEDDATSLSYALHVDLDRSTSTHLIPLSQITYISEEPIGTGSFGQVYACDISKRFVYQMQSVSLIRGIDYDPGFFALKRFHPISIDQCESLFRELEVWSRLSYHSNIVKFYGAIEPIFDEAKETIIVQFVLQKCDCTLNHYLKFIYELDSEANKDASSSFDLDRLNIALDIAQGMKFLHENEVLHRDLHSKNILMYGNRGVITDFGMSKFLNSKDPSYMDMPSAIHMCRWIAPPEIDDFDEDEISLARIGFKTDVFSFGIILWEILVLHDIWSWQSSESLGRFIRQSTQHLETVPEKIDKWVELFYLEKNNCISGVDFLYSIMLQCLAEDPMERPTFSEIVNELAHFIKPEEIDESHSQSQLEIQSFLESLKAEAEDDLITFQEEAEEDQNQQFDET